MEKFYHRMGWNMSTQNKNEKKLNRNTGLYTSIFTFVFVVCCFVFIFTSESEQNLASLYPGKEIHLTHNFSLEAMQDLERNNSWATVKKVLDKEQMDELWKKGVVAVNATQVEAEKLLELDPDLYWYPMYRSGPVIVAHESVAQEIVSFSDLRKSKFKVVIPKFHMEKIVVALDCLFSRGNLDSHKGFQLLKEKRHDKKLVFSEVGFYEDTNTIAIMLFDYAWDTKPEDWKIILPDEKGFFYTEGILSKVPLNVSRSFFSEEGLSEKGFFSREVKEFLKEKTLEIKNPQLYIKSYILSAPRVRRQILHERLFSPSYPMEYMLSYLVVLLFLLFWGYTLYMRIIDYKKKKNFLIILSMMALWIFIRMVKYMAPIESTVYRYSMYAYYIPQLIIPYFTFKIAFEDMSKYRFMQKAIKINAAVLITLLTFVMTNDVFRLLYSEIQIAEKVRTKYGPLYYVAMLYIVINIVASFIKMQNSSSHVPGRFRFLFPFIPMLFYASYGYGYYKRIDFFYTSDTAFVASFFYLLFFESCFFAGFFTGTFRYEHLFKMSRMKMVLLDRNLVPRMETRVKLDTDMMKIAVEELSEKDSFYNLCQNDTKVLRGEKISGGYVVWWKDISKVKELESKLHKISESLEKDIAFLKERGKVESRLHATRWKSEVYAEIEEEIQQGFCEIEEFVDAYYKGVKDEKEMYEFLCSVSYAVRVVKRKVNLMLIGKATDTIKEAELMLSIVDSASALSMKPDAMSIGEEERTFHLWVALLIYDVATELMRGSFSHGSALVGMNIRTETFKYRAVFYFDKVIDVKLSEDLSKKIENMNGTFIRNVEDVSDETTYMLILSDLI